MFAKDKIITVLLYSTHSWIKNWKTTTPCIFFFLKGTPCIFYSMCSQYFFKKFRTNMSLKSFLLSFRKKPWIRKGKIEMRRLFWDTTDRGSRIKKQKVTLFWSESLFSCCRSLLAFFESSAVIRWISNKQPCSSESFELDKARQFFFHPVHMLHFIDAS